MKKYNKHLGKEYKLPIANLKTNNEWLTSPLKNNLTYLKTSHYKYYKAQAKIENKTLKQINIQCKLGNLNEN